MTEIKPIRERAFVAVRNQIAADSVLDGFDEATARAGDRRNATSDGLYGGEPQRLGPEGRGDESPGVTKHRLDLLERSTTYEADRAGDTQLGWRAVRERLGALLHLRFCSRAAGRLVSTRAKARRSRSTPFSRSSRPA